MTKAVKKVYSRRQKSTWQISLVGKKLPAGNFGDVIDLEQMLKRREHVEFHFSKLTHVIQRYA